MAQHDYVIDNASGATVRADINSALSAIQTLNSGTSEPSSTAAGMLWLDTTGGAPYALKIRDAGNNHWLTIANITDPGSDANLSVAAIEGTNVLSTGESGGTKFLREDGDGSCSFQEVGEHIFLEKFTASSTSEKIFNLDSFTAYNSYLLLFNHFRPASDNPTLRIQLGTSSSTFRESAGDYEAVHNYSQYNGSNALDTHDTSSLDIAFINSVSFDAGTGVSGFVRLFDPLDSSKHTNSIYGFNCVNSGSYTIAAQGSGTNLATTDDAFIRCKYSSGFISSGTISLYGVRNG